MSDTGKPKPKLTLTNCDPGRRYTVVSCAGGENFRRRLHNIGLAEGKTIFKIHSHPFRGPVTIRVHNTAIAVGHSMAERIEVKPLSDEATDPDR